jgi:hypothetical protein
MAKTKTKQESAEAAMSGVMDVAEGLMENLTGSSPVGDVDDLEDSCVEGFFDLVNAVEGLRQAMRRQGYKVPKVSL